MKSKYVPLILIAWLANLLLFFSPVTAFSQSLNQKKSDSLLRALKTAKPDTDKIMILSNLVKIYLGVDDSKSVEFSNLAIKLADSLGHKRGLAMLYQNLGVAYHNLGKYPSSIEVYIKALKLREEIGDKKGTAAIYNNIGNILHFQGKYKEALENYNKALAVYLEVLPNIKPEVIFEFKRGWGNTYSNIGNIYREQGELKPALENYNKALKIRQEIGDEQGVSICYICMGITADMMKEFDKAIDYDLNAFAIQNKIGDKYNMTYSLMGLGSAYGQKKQYAKAVEYLNKCADVCKELNARKELYDTYATLASVYESMGDYKNAFESYRLYSQQKDSILNKESAQQITEMQTKYDTEKKEREILLLNKDKALQQSEIEKEKNFRNSLMGLVGLVVVLLAVLLVAYSAKKKSNLLLTSKNQEIEHQKKLVDEAYESLHEKNQEVMDSIFYARRIQRALLPTENYMVRQFNKLRGM